MSEWEKMLSGVMYNDFDKDLFERRIAAKKLFRAYNKSEDEETDLRESLMAKLFQSVGKHVWIEPDFRCEYGKNICLADDVYINFGCVILDCAKVSIGSNTLIGPNVGIYTANHALDLAERKAGGCIGRPVTIGENVWIGGNTVILGGVTIGESAVIGAGSVVTKDVPANTIAVGNPARILRPITEADKTNYRA